MGVTQRLGTIPLAIFTDASNNVGIGTSTIGGRLDVRASGTSAFSYYFRNSAGGYGGGIYNTGSNNTQLYLATSAGTENVLLSASGTSYLNGGSVAIGTSSPSSIFEVAQTNGIITQRGNTGYSVFRSYGGDGTNSDVVEFQIRNRVDGSNMVSIGNFTSHDLTFRTANTERMRITSGGYTQITSTNSYASTSSTAHAIISNRNNDNNLYLVHSGSNPYGPYIWFTNAAPNNTTNYFLLCSDSSADRFSFRSNGGLANYQANNVNLSDARTKKDIIPLESYWDKFKAIEIVKFKYKDQTHDDFNIGVIAQQVEEVAPEFVDIDGWSKPKLDDDGNQIISEEEPLKAIYTADLHHATIKVLQEAMSKIEELEAKVSALENKS